VDACQTIEGAFARGIGEEVEGGTLTEFGDLLYAARSEFLVENAHKLLLLFYNVKANLPPHLVLSSAHTDSAWVDAQTMERYTIYATDKAAVLKALVR
jgi:hypothetical protein